MQNFRSFRPLGAVLWHPPVQKSGLCSPPFFKFFQFFWHPSQTKRFSCTFGQKITYFYILGGQHVHLTPQKCFLEAFSTKCPWNATTPPGSTLTSRSPDKVGLTEWQFFLVMNDVLSYSLCRNWIFCQIYSILVLNKRNEIERKILNVPRTVLDMQSDKSFLKKNSTSSLFCWLFPYPHLL